MPYQERRTDPTTPRRLTNPGYTPGFFSMKAMTMFVLYAVILGLALIMVGHVSGQAQTSLSDGFIAHMRELVWVGLRVLAIISCVVIMLLPIMARMEISD
jgi:vacuolar-type H+-ATPase subunit I/STV1